MNNTSDDYPDADEALKDIMENLEIDNTTKLLFCDFVSQGIFSWPKSVAVRSCSDNVVYSYAKNIIAKHCSLNGIWLDANKTDATLSSDDACNALTIANKTDADELLVRWFPVIKVVAQTGYCVSLLALTVAVGIFLTIRKLRCARNRLHLQLFISFSMRAFMALLKDSLFVNGVAMINDIVFVSGKVVFVKANGAWLCKIVTTCWEYFILANYLWILMEGFYLHRLIFSSFYSDNADITVYCCIAWGFPAVFISVWVLSRLRYEDTLCWTTHEDLRIFMLIRLPIVVSVLISFGLLVNIVRVLMAKLNTSLHIKKKRMRYKRLVRSTLVLMPLCGAHYTLFLIMSYAADLEPWLMIAWLLFDQFFSSFQGFCVAMLYCILNGEVQSEVKRKIRLCLTRRKSSIVN